VIDAGGVSFNDINTSPTRAGSHREARDHRHRHVRIGDRIFNPVRWAMSLHCWPGRSERSSGTRRRPDTPRRNQVASRMTQLPRDAVPPLSRTFSNRRIESSSKRQSTSGIVPLLRRRRGGALPAALGLDRVGHRGHAGYRTRRPVATDVLFTGEGSHQLTANDIGRLGRSGLSRSSSSSQRGLHGRAGARRRIRMGLQRPALWNYHACRRLGCRGWFTARVTRSVSSTPRWQGRHRRIGGYIEVVTGKMDICRRASPWPTSASTPCMRTVKPQRLAIQRQWKGEDGSLPHTGSAGRPDRFSPRLVLVNITRKEQVWQRPSQRTGDMSSRYRRQSLWEITHWRSDADRSSNPKTSNSAGFTVVRFVVGVSTFF